MKWENHVLKKIYITRSIACYYKAKINFELIIYNDLSLIKKEYKDYLTTNNLPIKDDNNESDDDSYFIYNNSLSSEKFLESRYEEWILDNKERKYNKKNKNREKDDKGEEILLFNNSEIFNLNCKYCNYYNLKDSFVINKFTKEIDNLSIEKKLYGFNN